MDELDFGLDADNSVLSTPTPISSTASISTSPAIIDNMPLSTNIQVTASSAIPVTTSSVSMLVTTSSGNTPMRSINF